MKFFLITIVATFCFAQASVDWSKVKAVKLKHPILDILGLVERRGSVKITGGVEVVPHSLPYQVGLLISASSGNYFCGGSLLTPTTILTGAQCGELSNNITAVLGAHDITKTEPTQVRVPVSVVIIHPQWHRLTMLNDISILRLAEPVELNENIGTIALPTRADAGNTYAGDIAIASGWGKDSDDATEIAQFLHSVDVPVITNTACDDVFSGVVKDTHLCTDGSFGKSICSDDYGGSLVNAGVQIGIISFGVSSACQRGYPSAYTRLTSYLDWIEQNSDVVIG